MRVRTFVSTLPAGEREESSPGVEPNQRHQEAAMLPQRTPKTKRPFPIEVAPPTVIRRLLEALDKWEPKRDAA